MPIVSIRLTDEQMLQISTNAISAHMSTTDFIKSKLFPEENQHEHQLTLEMVLFKISELKSGDLFEIPNLFSPEVWRSYTNTVSIGRSFRIESKKPNSLISSKVVFIEKKSGHSAVYQVI